MSILCYSKPPSVYSLLLSGGDLSSNLDLVADFQAMCLSFRDLDRDFFSGFSGGGGFKAHVINSFISKTPSPSTSAYLIISLHSSTDGGCFRPLSSIWSSTLFRTPSPSPSKIGNSSISSWAYSAVSQAWFFLWPPSLSVEHDILYIKF